MIDKFQVSQVDLMSAGICDIEQEIEDLKWDQHNFSFQRESNGFNPFHPSDTSQIQSLYRAGNLPPFSYFLRGSNKC